MKPSASRIERMLAKVEEVEATLAPPPRKCLSAIVHEEKDDEAAAMEKAVAEHIAAHPEDAGRTVKDFRWVVWRIVHKPQETIENKDLVIEARNETIKEVEELPAPARKEWNGDENGSGNGRATTNTDGPSETLVEPIDLPLPDPGCLARSKPWRPVHQRGRRRPADAERYGE